MGRGVDYLSNASKVTYFPWNLGDEDDEYERIPDEDAWEDEVAYLIETLTSRFKSLHEPDSKRWDGKETEIILENNLVEFGLSEYCGLVSLSARPISEDTNALAENWLSRIWPKLLEALQQNGFDAMYRLGTMSNGESVFRSLGA